MKLFVILAVAALLAGGVAFAFARTPQPIDRTTVRTLDPNRYMGRWYEIARYDHSFERNLAQVQALYTLQPDSRITVENSGVDTRSGRRGVAHGKARTTADPGRLRVSFFWIFYSDYNILELDPDYRWALVGSRSPKYLWILSRTPTLALETLDEILRRARARGYDTSRLIYVQQPE